MESVLLLLQLLLLVVVVVVEKGLELTVVWVHHSSRRNQVEA
jgi:hypothetical protein